jgi:hypothetical protein
MTRIIALAAVLTLTAGAANAAAPHCARGKVACGSTCITKGKACHMAAVVHVTHPSGYQ